MQSLIETFDLLMLILQLVIIGVVFAVVLVSYLRQRQSTFLYLVLSLFFLLGQKLSWLFLALTIPKNLDESGTFQELADQIMILLPLGDGIISLIGVFFFLLLFFQAFESDTVLTRRNLIYTYIYLILTVSLIISVLTIVFSVPTLASFNESEDNILLVIIFPLLIMVFSLLISFIFTGVMAVEIYRKVQRKLNQVRDPVIKKVLKRMRYAVLLIALGYLAFFVTDYVTAEILSVIGFTALVYLYLSTGKYVLQDEALRHLILVNNDGMPLYGYEFQKRLLNEETSAYGGMLISDQEILFSGALKAVSTLIGEFTGAGDMSLREIVLDNSVMMVSRIQGTEVNVVLLADKSTQYFRDALQMFTQQIQVLVNEDSTPTNPFAKEQVKVANEILIANFGAGFVS